MPKIKTIYCKSCGEITPHNIEREDEGFDKVFGFIFTLGFNEMINKQYITCTRCKYKITKMP